MPRLTEVEPRQLENPWPAMQQEFSSNAERVPVPNTDPAAQWYGRTIGYLPSYVKARVHLADIQPAALHIQGWDAPESGEDADGLIWISIDRSWRGAWR